MSRHPIFARLFARASRYEDALGVTDHRRELLEGLAGRVIEVGAGNGLNFAHYPPAVTEVIAVEPESYLRRLAERAAVQAPVPIRVLDGDADALPLENASFDAAVASLVLCSVPDQATALAELARVLKPDGELRFYEHVASEWPGLLKLQRSLDHLWPHFAGGCHTSRDTVAAIEAAGFHVERCRRFTFRPNVLAAPTSPQVIGSACAPR